MSTPDDLPLLSRPRGPDVDEVEVRIKLPLRYASALDTLAIQDHSNRTALVHAAIKEYLDSRLYDAKMLVRMWDGNPTSVDQP